MNETFVLTNTTRDAWPAIRGFVYQIDSTITEWINLSENEYLELEWGEDIDIISHSLDAGEAGSRTLAQVKCTDGTLTLRSKEALQAVCSYAGHLKSNPDVRLMFRFLTTATPGHERPAKPLRSTPGIELWEKIRTQEIEREERHAASNSIAAFFQSMSIPKSVQPEEWQVLTEAIANPAFFDQIIDTFQWSTGSQPASGTEERVQGLLVEHGFAVDTTSARSQHDRLFVFLMRFLSRPKSAGTRRLGGRDLSSCLESTKIEPHEQRVLNEVQRTRHEMIERLAGLKSDIETVKTGIGDIKERLDLGYVRRETPLRAVIDSNAVVNTFGIASTSLLTWPTETRGKWLDRPEMDNLYEKLKDKESSCTVLLGIPGCGKSALLARLGKKLQTDGQVLLAIKSDILPRGVESLVALDEFLGLTNSLTESIKEIASHGAVFLLVDQLDALGSLMDLHTQRLGVLLKVINALKGTKNVHILVSCREFDFQYDARFKALQAERQTLADLDWETVQKLLESEGISTTLWPAEIRETMRTPQHLSFFLENFSHDPKAPVFSNYQAMLHEVFTHRVLRVSTLGPRAMEACEKIASAMSDLEELWVARSAFDSPYSVQIDGLRGTGILRQEGLKIGFRHQTLFDYVRTRAFTSGSQNLFEYVLLRQDALFVRSTLWAALQALRATSASRYHEEFGNLWTHGSLRLHVRSMLITFLGQVMLPDPEEAGWLVSTLDNPSLCGKSLIAITGNEGWFKRILSRLPSLMLTTDPAILELVGRLLQAALRFDHRTVLALIEQYWANNDRDAIVLNILADLREWDEHAISLVERRMRRTPIVTWHVVCLAKSASKSAPILAPRIVGTALLQRLEHAEKQDPGPYEPSTKDDTPVGKAVHLLLEWKHNTQAVRQLVREHGWYGLEEIVDAAPYALVEQVWPWFLTAAQILLREQIRSIVAYRMSDEFDLAGAMERHDLLNTLRLAVVKCAEVDPRTFLKFAQEMAGYELELVHRILAAGFQAIALGYPQEVLKYLSSDPRRLALGDDTNRHRETAMLISAVVPYLRAEDIKNLEQVIANWEYYPTDPSDTPQLRAGKDLRNREHRLRLMRAFPKDSLSPESERARAEEELSLPGTLDEDIRTVGGFISSPMTAGQMESVSDDEILSIMTKPGDEFSGNASYDFGEFAKKQPDRAMAILERLRVGEREGAAGLAIHNISQLQKYDGPRLVGLIRALDGRGFSSEDFRCSASWALTTIADQAGGLDDATCTMLRGWLQPAPKRTSQSDDEKPEPKAQSLLWGYQFGILPRGNYPILEALLHAYLKRTPPSVDEWLSILEEHIDTQEDIEVWRSLARNLYSLGLAKDVTRPAQFIEELIGDHPSVLTSLEGVRFIAMSHEWLPEETTHKCLKKIEQSDWDLKGQALGELAMLRFALVPSDAFCRAIMDRALGRLPSSSPHDNDVRIGLAFSASNLWGVSRLREAASSVLIPLVPYSDLSLGAAIMDAFRLTPNMPPDRWTADLLRAIASRPNILNLEGHTFLAQRLKELLVDGFNPQVVAEVAKAMLRASGSAIGDTRTSWVLDAGHLIEIALTLQRMKTTRSEGLDLFEALLEQRAYEADKVLRDIDRRIA